MLSLFCAKLSQRTSFFMNAYVLFLNTKILVQNLCRDVLSLFKWRNISTRYTSLLIHISSKRKMKIKILLCCLTQTQLQKTVAVWSQACKLFMMIVLIHLILQSVSGMILQNTKYRVTQTAEPIKNLLNPTKIQQTLSTLQDLNFSLCKIIPHSFSL